MQGGSGVNAECHGWGMNMAGKVHTRHLAKAVPSAVTPHPISSIITLFHIDF